MITGMRPNVAHHRPQSSPRIPYRHRHQYSLSSFYLLLTISAFFWTGADCLKCYVCSRYENPTYTIDISESFRIVDELSQDHCLHLEEVQCDRGNDICVTIVQYKIDEGSRRGSAPRSYTISKGCYQSTALDLTGAVYKRGCHKEPAEVKEDITSAQFPSRRINIHQAIRHTCVCSTNRCNAAYSTHTKSTDHWIRRARTWTGLAAVLIHLVFYSPYS